MALKKVLVLCQRKTGPLITYRRVEDVITPKLETLVKKYIYTHVVLD